MVPLLTGANLLDALEQAAVVTDLAATIVYWNRAAEALYGWARDEAIGRPVFEVTPTTASRRLGEEIFEAVRLGRRWSGDYPVQRKDSSTFLASVSLGPVRDSAGVHVGVLGLSTDVTEARLQQGRANDIAERLQLAVEAGHLGSWQWNRSNGEIQWDEKMERIFGLSPGGFAGTVDAWFDLLHPADRDMVLEIMDQIVKGEMSHPAVEYRILLPGGGVRRVKGRGRALWAPDGKILGTVGYMRAVDEVRQRGSERPQPG